MTSGHFQTTILPPRPEFAARSPDSIVIAITLNFLCRDIHTSAAFPIGATLSMNATAVLSVQGLCRSPWWRHRLSSYAPTGQAAEQAFLWTWQWHAGRRERLTSAHGLVLLILLLLPSATG